MSVAGVAHCGGLRHGLLRWELALRESAMPSPDEAAREMRTRDRARGATEPSTLSHTRSADPQRGRTSRLRRGRAHEGSLRGARAAGGEDGVHQSELRAAVVGAGDLQHRRLYLGYRADPVDRDLGLGGAVVVAAGGGGRGAGGDDPADRGWADCGRLRRSVGQARDDDRGDGDPGGAGRAADHPRGGSCRSLGIRTSPAGGCSA